MNLTKFVEPVDDTRAQEVLKELRSLRDATKTNFFSVCSLLLEAYEGNMHRTWGYTKFGEWVENADLDMGSRAAYYLLGIAKRSRELGISNEELSKLNVSKLKEIFSLDPTEYGDSMRSLITDGEDMTTDEIKERVNTLKLKAGDEVYSHINVKIPALAKQTVLEAFELARKMHGSTVDEYGEVKDISDGKCLEYIAASFLLDPNNHGEEGHYEGTADEIQDSVGGA